ncbi:MAG: hypothetical protein R2813_06760 [Flavobacteriales bacterium]
MKQLIAFTIITIVTAHSFAQKGTLTPYSIYGLGDPTRSQTTAIASMGGANLAVVSTTGINSTNPATYSDIKRPSFNLDLKNEVLTLSNSSNSQSSNAFAIQNFSFAFPIINNFKKFKRRAGLSFGVTPLTAAGYDLSYTSSVNGLGEVDYLFFGEGGINSAQLGGSFDLVANKSRTNVLSIGANANYIFGQISRNRATQVDVRAGASNVYRQSYLELSDFDLSGGLLFKHVDTLSVSKKNADGTKYTDEVPFMYSIGAYIRPSRQVTASVHEYGFTFSDTVTNPSPIDTVQSHSAHEKLSTPISAGIGFSFNVANKWTIAADLVHTQWSTLSLGGKNYALNNLTRLSLGTELLPKVDIKDADGKYLKTVRYRAGFSFELSPFNVGGVQPIRYGINFGLGFPLTAASLSNSMFNIGFEAARRQAAGYSLTENYMNIYAGIVITPHVYDQWFAKRKYD